MDRLGHLFINEMASSLLSAVFGVSVEEISHHTANWRKANNIIKFDIKNIQKAFGQNNDQKGSFLKKRENKNPLTEKTIAFFKEKVVPSFKYYSSSDLSKANDNSLWEDYVRFLMQNGIEVNEHNDEEIREKLIDCLNKHNNKLRQANLTAKDVITHSITETGFKNVETILHQIADTLCLDTDLQDTDRKLDYLTRQIEGILKSLRIDLQKSGNTILKMLICLVVNALITAASLWFTLNQVDSRIASVVLLFLSLILVLTFIPLFLTLSKAMQKEKKINQTCSDLLDFHFDLYKSFVSNRINGYIPDESEKEISSHD